MGSIDRTFPRWMQEFRRFQRLKSQLFLYGNVYDSYLFPFNHASSSTAEELDWKRFTDMSLLLGHYLRGEGYDLVCAYDPVDGIEVKPRECSVGLIASCEKAKDRFGSDSLETIGRSMANALRLFRDLVADESRTFAGIIRFASRISSDPLRLSDDESRLFVGLVKAAQEAAVFHDRNDMRNLLILVCDKLSDIPPWVLLENPLVKGIEVGRPSKEERRRFFQSRLETFHHDGEEGDQAVTESVFSDITEGFHTHQLENLATISRVERMPVNRIHEIVDLYKYGTRVNFWGNLEQTKLDRAERELRSRVMGQEQAIRKALQIVRCAKHGLNAIDQRGRTSKPKGVLFLAGPTGVGKTELAKSLAELIFNDEEAIIRLDMSEYNDSNSDVKLIGAPPGYVGYEEGGQLTAKVKSRPFSIILFDEIEKAHPVVFDKFLQILDEGRLTDGKGETVYFSETLILFTSNLGMNTVDPQGRRVANVDYRKDSLESMTTKIMDEIKRFFKTELNRPEILNRFGDNFVVFDFIRPAVGLRILEKNLATIRDNLRERLHCEWNYNEAFVQDFHHTFVADNLENGGRGILNRIDTHIKKGIGDFMAAQCLNEGVRFTSHIEHDSTPRVAFACI